VIFGVPEQARWIRSEPRRVLDPDVLERMVRTAFPGARVAEAQPLAQGLRNTNIRVRLDRPPGWIVLRIYEHDASLCQKEVDLIRLAGRFVPVAEVIHAEPRGWEGLPPFALVRYVEAITFLELKRHGDLHAIAEAAGSVGETLAALGRIAFEKPGWIAPGPSVTAPLLEGPDPMPRFVDLCLASANFQRRVAADLCERIQALVWAWAPRLARLDEDPRLVHCDFSRRNLLVRPDGGRWSVAAVLDWEFAVSGPPLIDVANFLRYERLAQPLAEPHFTNGYRRAGGSLPENWREFARMVDLTALCDSLTRDQLPDDVERELVELVRATVEARDPE